MSTEIYYFTGTGNSLFVAKDIAEKTGAVLIPIASLKDRKSIITDADIIGIVFPVYYGELPIIIDKFVRKIEGISGKYIFAVCTYGGAADASLRILKRIIRSSGGVLSAAYGVHMPQNAFLKPKENHQKLFMEWKKKLEFIDKNTKAKAEGVFYSNVLLELLFIPIHVFLIKPVMNKHFRRISNLPPNLKTEEHMHAMDMNFKTNEDCNGCGTCSKVCPVDNIIISDSRPTWLHHCENCLACYNWCPNKAIQGGMSTKDFYYHQPEIKITEIMEQK
ncbi:MAG: EFR1 family ferrodoxin [Mobilitalea sp.]